MATGFTPEYSTGFECPVCFEPMNNPESDRSPRLLKCNHFFCKECLENIVTNDSILCPMCRVSTEVDGGDISDLPLHIFPPSLTHGDLDESCQILVMSLYQELAEYKRTSVHQANNEMEEELKQAKKREMALIQQVEHYKNMVHHMKIFRGEVLRIDTNKQTLLAQHEDEINRLKADTDRTNNKIKVENKELKEKLKRTQDVCLFCIALLVVLVAFLALKMIN